MAMESKYDRRNPGGTNQPMPQKAGSAFADLARLLLFLPCEPCGRYFVYRTDGELARYLDNPRNGLQAFFSLRQDRRLTIDSQFFAGRSAPFLHSCLPWCPRCMFCDEFADGGHQLVRHFHDGMGLVLERSFVLRHRFVLRLLPVVGKYLANPLLIPPRWKHAVWFRIGSVDDPQIPPRSRPANGNSGTFTPWRSPQHILDLVRDDFMPEKI